MEKYFQVKEKGSTVKTEVLAGLTTFMAMAYILMVNSGMFSDLAEMNGVTGDRMYNAVYIATAISAVAGTLLIGLLANLPLAQASGMGLNAFFVYTVCFGFGLTYANGLLLVLFDGVLFIALTLTGVRKKIFDAIPACVRMAIPAGIGLFIAFLGLQNAGIVVQNSSTCVTLVSFNVFNGSATWATIMPLLVTIFALIAIAALSAKKVKGAVFWGMLGSTVVYYILGFTVKDFYVGFGDKFNFNPFAAFKDFGEIALGKVFTQGVDFSGYLDNHSTASLVILLITTALAFCLVDMFDTLGTLFGACSRGNMLTEKGEVPNFEKAMLSDAIATVCGSVCGTSTVTTFVEASSGIAEGGRTGLSAMVTAGMFFIAMFLSPVASLIPGCATAAVLIFVGVLMMGAVLKIEWNDPAIALPAFLTISFMPFTYNISYGIAFGLISYIFLKLFTGKAKEINVGTWVIGVLFAVMFFVTH
ncbi:MAG: NCS2 family permease [Lachnospiraceae bacterium]|jgi:AGZA family xanthine/uracil permease-like MFS transporter|nr:NCS2 family permease [Lachnospiraceae bacterium]MCX4347422.1 NCS2 family permease [Lachnospiraceae bacterium]